MGYLVILEEMSEKTMTMINNMDEEQNKTDTNKKFDNFFVKYLFGMSLLFCIPPFLKFRIDFSTLDPRSLEANLLLFIISTILILLSILLYISPLIFQLLKHRSLTKNDFSAIENEVSNPTKNSYKTRRIFLWFCSIGTLMVLIAQITFLIVLIIIC